MLRRFVDMLSRELELSPTPKFNEQKTCLFPLNSEITVALRDLDPGVSFHAPLVLCPEKKREALFISLMQANLLGQGTGGGRIGLEKEERSLTLSLGIPYEMEYQAFREHFEDFVNYLVYWRKEIEKFVREETLL